MFIIVLQLVEVEGDTGGQDPTRIITENQVDSDEDLHQGITDTAAGMYTSPPIAAAALIMSNHLSLSAYCGLRSFYGCLLCSLLP